MAIQSPDFALPLQELFAMVGQQTNNARSQQRGDAEIYAQAKRYEMQERERKQKEAIEAALATLQQTGEASPAVQGILGTTPYGGMIEPGGKLRVTPEIREDRARKAAEHAARLKQIEASTALAKTRGAMQESMLQGTEAWDDSLNPDADSEAMIIAGIQRGAIKPEQGMRMLIAARQAKATNEYRNSRPMPGAATAARQERVDTDGKVLAILTAEIDEELQKAGGDPAKVIKMAVENQAKLGLSGAGLRDYADRVIRRAKEF